MKIFKIKNDRQAEIVTKLSDILSSVSIILLIADILFLIASEIFDDKSLTTQVTVLAIVVMCVSMLEMSMKNLVYEWMLEAQERQLREDDQLLEAQDQKLKSLQKILERFLL